MSLVNAAWKVLHAACVPGGIVASTQMSDNYRRVWARDSVIAGLAGVMANDSKVIEGLRQSIFSLKAAQKPLGQIPSNVTVSDAGLVQGVSYGTLAARIDAVSWYCIGAATITQLGLVSAEESLALQDSLGKAFDVLDIAEYNGRGLVYVPQGGNWADEYVTQAYTLYDQLLRARALDLAGKVWAREDWSTKSRFIYKVIEANYWADNLPVSSTYRYRPAEADAHLQLPMTPYWYCAIAPSGYDNRFDLFANALALTSPICQANQAESVLTYIKTLMTQTQNLVPTFYPVIHENSTEWAQLKAHHLYAFKNAPGCFHNGGVWPMTLGWLGLGAARWGNTELAATLLTALEDALKTNDSEEYHLYEYISSLNFKTGGIQDLTFSASGVVLLDLVAQRKIDNFFI